MAMNKKNVVFLFDLMKLKTQLVNTFVRYYLFTDQ